MRPLFPYYGSKWRDAKRYPAPRGLRSVVEPFAGSAGYSCWYEPASVLLIDSDPIIVGVWDYLIRTTPSEILALPDLMLGQSTDELALPQEAKWLIGFWVNRGSATPKKTQTAYSRGTNGHQLVWSDRARVRIAAEMHRVKHWQVKQGDYTSAPDDMLATWFIDAPYVDKGKYYRHHKVDYKALADWALNRSGQSIVCEQAGADWLPFQPLASIKSSRGRSEEVVYIVEGV